MKIELKQNKMIEKNIAMFENGFDFYYLDKYADGSYGIRTKSSEIETGMSYAKALKAFDALEQELSNSFML